MPRNGGRNHAYDELQRSLGFSELTIAVSKGHFQTVRLLIDSGMDLNCQESKLGMTPIYAAIGTKNARMIEELIRAGADPNFKNDKPEKSSRLLFATPLFFAVWAGDLEDIEALLNNGADIHARDSEDETTALHLALTLGRVKSSKFLIEHGFDVNSRIKQDKTPLHFATKYGLTQIVELLIAKGANISTTYMDDKLKLNLSAVLMAAVLGHLDIFNILVKAGADVNMKTSDNNTALHIIAQKGTLEAMNLFLAAGAERSVNIRSNFKEYTPLLFAAEAGRTDIVEALLKVKGIEIDAMSISMETPLAVAASNGHLSIVELLVANGALINSRQSNMMTPLHVALGAKEDAVAEFLIKRGADIHAIDETNATPLHTACKIGVTLKIVKALVEKGADVNPRTNNDSTPLLCAAESDYLKVMKLLIYHGADCNASNKKNWTALHIAASRGSVKMVTYLVTKVSDIDVMSLFHATPLHCAVEGGHQEVVRVLLKSNANVNAQDVTKRTPLHIASEKGDPEIAELLLRHNAFVNLKDNNGCTPLFLAIEHKHEKLVSLLLDKGADVNAANKCGILPIHVAAKAENVGIVKVLLTKGAYYGVEGKAEGYSGTPLKFARKAKNAKLIIILEIIRKLFSSVIKNNTDQIVLCVQAGAIVNAKKASGKTALHYAVSNYNSDAVKALLTSDADIFLATDKGDLPLQIALAKGCTKIPEILLAHAKNLSLVKHNAVVNAKTAEGSGTVLHTAAENNKVHIVKFLLANGAVYNAQNNAGKTPSELTTDEAIKSLLIAAEKLFEVVKKKDSLKEVVQIAANIKSAVNAREVDSGATPLYWSILKGHTGIAHALLSNGADYCLVTNEGMTPLHIAASEGNVEIFKVLINRAKNDNTKKANNFINSATLSGTVALHVASNAEVVKCLLEAGATHDIRNGEDKTALELTRNDDVRKLLKIVHQLFEDVGKRVFIVMNKLNVLKAEEFKAVASTRNAQGQTLVQVARANGHVKIANRVQEKLKKLG